MKRQYKIVATIGQSVGFNVFGRDGMGNAVLDQSRKIIIKGGAGVYDGTSRRIISAEQTIVTQDELDLLRQNPLFKIWEKNGYLAVSAKNDDTATVASNLEPKDACAQRTTTDLPKGTNVANRNGEIIIESEETPQTEKIEITTGKKPTKKRSK